MGFHGYRAPSALSGPGGGRTLRLRSSDEAAGTAPGVTRLHYRLPARDWRGAAHPSTQRPPAATRHPPVSRRPRLCRIDSFTLYTIIHRTSTTTTTMRARGAARPRERAARARCPARPPAARAHTTRPRHAHRITDHPPIYQPTQPHTTPITNFIK